MYIYSRMATLRPGRFGPGVEWITKLNAAAATACGIDSTVHMGVLGFPSGTIGASLRLDSLAQLDQVMDKVMVDADYNALNAASGDYLASPFEPQIVEVLAAHNLADKPAKYHHLIRAQMAGGQNLAGTTWGVGIAKYVSDLTGRPVVFGRSPWGPMGAVGWLIGFDNAGEIDEVQQTINNDPGYIERVDAAGGFFVTCASHSGLIRQID